MVAENYLDTANVPCRFFLQNSCTAGAACPFSHDLESSIRPAPCMLLRLLEVLYLHIVTAVFLGKYFQRGSCKFGRKCALLHITQDGTVVNRPMQPGFSAGPPFPGPPPQTQAGVYGQPPPGLLSIQAQGLDQRSNADGGIDFENYQFAPRTSYEQQPVDMTFTSASPTYGSPPQTEQFGISPPQKGLSVLDAPLPNSFDSNGISMAARNGPFAASVPSRFGIESPPSSLPRASQLSNAAVRNLHSSAFGERGMDGVLASVGSSPPSGTDEPFTFAKRPLHSARLRASRPMVSASLGTRLPTMLFEYSDDEEDPDREEDLLPASLRDLIPEGRSRRESRSRLDEDTPAGFLSAARRTLSGHGVPQEGKVGSLGTSPSRYSSMFVRGQPNKSDGEFGHVGSPLRNSGLYFTTPSRASNGDMSPILSSPPRQASMSMLTQELQRTKLEAARSEAARSQVQATAGAPSHSSAPVRTLSNGGSTGRSSLDRGLSSTSVGKIDEEQELFDMEEVGPRSMPNGEGFGAIGGHRISR